MYQSVNFSDFVNAFRSHDRENQFSYEAKQMIFDFLEDYERDSGEQVELDVIAICCDFSEMSESELRQSYSIDADVNCSDFLEDNTYFIGEFIKEHRNGDTEAVYVFQQF